jgi:hypothetical protein
MRERAVRQARNEALHREVNERLAKIDEHAEVGWAEPGQLFEFLCECGADDGCSERVTMTLAEYEQVRQQNDRFVVVPGHENSQIENVVEERERYLVVDKIRAVEPFVADDPRGAPSS